MANHQAIYDSTRKVFRSLFDEHRIVWDILRTPWYFVAKRNVKQFMPPESFVARNYISNPDTCKIRMSRLQILPWLSLFVTPDNAILYSENDPIVPTENSKWQVVNYDNCKLGGTDSYDPAQHGFQVDNTPITPYADASVQFIPSRNIAIPQEHRALNFNPNGPSDINMDSTSLFNSSDAICNPQLDLEIGLSTHEDFRMGNIDSDINRFQRLDYNKGAENRMKNSLLQTGLPMADTAYNPNYARLDDSWSKYLASIDEDNDSIPPSAKRHRDGQPVDDIGQPGTSHSFETEQEPPLTTSQFEPFT